MSFFVPFIFAHADTGSTGAQVPRWTAFRLALGVAQMVGASSGIILLAVSGVTAWSLALVLATTFGTTLSVLLFGSRSRQ